jgi:hypothetical protein
MNSNLFEWVVRTGMLVLAGLVTLSILGSIAAMSNDVGSPGGVGVRRPPALAPQPAEPSAQPPAPSTQADPQASSPTPTAPATGEYVTVPAPPEPPKPERWLEAIAYALLAIAGLLALVLIALWRGVVALARIADRADLGHQNR